jgi:hypothetical protein
MKKDIMAKRFLKHNFHDTLLKAIHIEPAEDRKSKSSVEVVLEDYDTNELIEIIFEQPGNISFTGDFDVLLDNAGFGNTSHTKASTDPDKILRTINRQKSKWNVKYAEDMRSPIEKKTNNIDKYIAFKLLFFGGSLEVLAKNYKIKRTKKRG